MFILVELKKAIRLLADLVQLMVRVPKNLLVYAKLSGQNTGRSSPISPQFGT